MSIDLTNPAIRAALPVGVMGAFAIMEIAEEELARTWPGKVGEPEDAFLAVKPPTALSDHPDWLIRAHIRELCQRGGDFGGGTLAEAVLVFERTSLAAPLRRDAALAYAATLRRLIDMLDEDERPDAEALTNEEARAVWGLPSHPDAIEEYIEDARRVGAIARADEVRACGRGA